MDRTQAVEANPADPVRAPARPTLFELCQAFATVGATSWGGFLASLPRLEAELVRRRGWLTLGQFHEALGVSTLIPGPSFFALATLVGYRYRGLPGALVSILALVLPGVGAVTLLVILFPAGDAGGLLADLQRAVSVAVAGILLGNAGALCRQAGWHRPGLLLAAACTLAVLLGLQPAWMVLGGLAAGALLLREAGGPSPEGRKEGAPR